MIRASNNRETAGSPRARVRARRAVVIAICLLVVAGCGSAAPASPETPTSTPTAEPTAVATTTRRPAPTPPPAAPSIPTPTPSPSATRKPTASPTAAPSATAAPSGSASASTTGPPSVQTYTITGQDYETIFLFGNKVVNLPGGAAQFVATRANPLGINAEYQLPLRLLPSDRKVVNVETAACGSASGEFFELYGPFDALPTEYEIRPPAPDGCWHFGMDDGSTYHVSIYVRGDAQMTISHISFTVTFAP